MAPFDWGASDPKLYQQKYNLLIDFIQGFI